MSTSGSTNFSITRAVAKDIIMLWYYIEDLPEVEEGKHFLDPSQKRRENDKTTLRTLIRDSPNTLTTNKNYIEELGCAPESKLQIILSYNAAVEFSIINPVEKLIREDEHCPLLIDKADYEFLKKCCTELIDWLAED
jgi:hypothetical protein